MFDVEYWHTALGIVGKLRRAVLQQIIHRLEVRDPGQNCIRETLITYVSYRTGLQLVSRNLSSMQISDKEPRATFSL